MVLILFITDPKTFFSPLSRSGIPQRSSESSVERMKNGRQNARPRLNFIQLERNQGMYPQFSSSNCVVLKMAYSEVWNRYVFFQCTAPRYPWGCSIVKILTNNLSYIGYVFGVGHGVDLRYRST